MKKLILILLLAITATPVFAQEGDKAHGGDACDKRIDDIRNDIQTWIKAGGSKGLNLTKQNISLEEYNTRMLELLADHAVVVACTNSVSVSGKEKTCKSYISDQDGRKHIDCDFERFYTKTTPSDQYWLVHHEFAGLAEIEKNNGASSEYLISKQITEYLTPMNVLKLGIKRHPSANPCPKNMQLNELRSEFSDIRMIFKKSHTIGIGEPSAPFNSKYEDSTLFMKGANPAKLQILKAGKNRKIFRVLPGASPLCYVGVNTMDLNPVCFIFTDSEVESLRLTFPESLTKKRQLTVTDLEKFYGDDIRLTCSNNERK